MPKLRYNDFVFETIDDIKGVEEFTGGNVHDVYLCNPNNTRECMCMVNIPEGESFYQLKLYPTVHIIKSNNGKFSTFPVSLKDAKAFKEKMGRDLVFFKEVYRNDII